MNPEHIEHLEKLHTRQLLDYLKHARKFNGNYNPNDLHYYTIEEIKAVLADREHIPNKQERKAQRQAAAKAKKAR